MSEHATLRPCAHCGADSARVRRDWASVWVECDTCGYAAPALPVVGSAMLSAPEAAEVVVTAWNLVRAPR